MFYYIMMFLNLFFAVVNLLLGLEANHIINIIVSMFNFSVFVFIFCTLVFGGADDKVNKKIHKS